MLANARIWIAWAWLAPSPSPSVGMMTSFWNFLPLECLAWFLGAQQETPGAWNAEVLRAEANWPHALSGESARETLRVQKLPHRSLSFHWKLSVQHFCPFSLCASVLLHDGNNTVKIIVFSPCTDVLQSYFHQDLVHIKRVSWEQQKNKGLKGD